ncbi:MAG: sulfide/dihydroorotate dehydrogenase-like FAD/NAD-binding protein [Candidatus Lokiarchaeota archaeon]|nr:sulfide/dihydroorotate dehydrogenase-like FAD/NAD-binding protein [Candidatus Lokiarchaeota archaeon]
MGYKIIKKKELVKNLIYEMEIYEKQISKKSQPGNFLLFRVNEKGERFPLTIADYNREKGTISIVFQVVGKSTKLLSLLNEGDEILDVIGPLGNNIQIKKYKYPVIVVAGGIGIAPCYPQARALKEAGNEIIIIIGARTRDLLFWKEKMALVSDQLIICTDDGSEGKKGVVTEPLKEIIIEQPISLVIAIGPLIMMKYVAKTTDGKLGFPKIPTMVSLNTIMIDGTGMCGGCRYSSLDGKIYFACVDGPDVDGHIVNFDNLIQRSIRFKEKEIISLENYENKCKAINKWESNN